MVTGTLGEGNDLVDELARDGGAALPDLVEDVGAEEHLRVGVEELFAFAQHIDGDDVGGAELRGLVA